MVDLLVLIKPAAQQNTVPTALRLVLRKTCETKQKQNKTKTKTTICTTGNEKKLIDT